MSSQQRDEKAQGLSRNNEQSSVKSEEMKVRVGADKTRESASARLCRT